MKAGLLGVGSALPENRITNDDLAQRLETNDEWIVKRTGIRARHLLKPGEPLEPLAARACNEALQQSGVAASEVDHLLLTTLTPDRLMPGLAPLVAGSIGAGKAACTDLNAACSGFLYGLDMAIGLIESGRARVVLLCGAEALSRITDPDDRGTAVIFGDGAGAMVVAAGEYAHGAGKFVFGNDSSHADLLYADMDERKIRMEGREVYRHAVARMVETMETALADSGLTVDDIGLFVPHQANARIIEAAARELGVPEDKVVITLDHVANTSSASIPLALAHAQADGRLQPGMVLAMSVFAAGFVWGAGIVRWRETPLTGQ